MKYKIKNWIKSKPRLDTKLKLIYFGLFETILSVIPDKLFLSLQYRLRTGLRLNLDEPRSFNEKLQWLKLNYKNPEIKNLVDKWEVRSFVAKKGLENILIPAYGPFQDPADIDLESVKPPYIIKLTNGSGFNYIVNDLSKETRQDISFHFSKWIKINFFWSRREWAYKDVRNRIIIEELVRGVNGGPPDDYRFFCFNGKPYIIAVDLDSVVDGIKTSNYYRHLYTPEWSPLETTIQYPKKGGYEVEKPHNLEELLEIASKLSTGFPAVRVDLYNTDKGPKFGELTFYHASGYQKFSTEQFALEMGNQIDTEKCPTY